MNYLHDKFMVLQLYETFYEIHDHVYDHKPLGLIRFNPKESHFKNTLYDNYLRDFMNSGIYERTGVNFEQAMELPYPRFIALFRVVTERNKSFDDMVDMFINLKVFNKTGLSFSEYSRLPYRDIDAINRRCAETLRKENKSGHDAFGKLEDDLDAIKGM